MSYLDDNPDAAKNAGYYRRQLKAVEQQLATVTAQNAELKRGLFKAETERGVMFEEYDKIRAELTKLRSEIATAKPVGEVSGNDWSSGLLYDDQEPGALLYLHPQAEGKVLVDAGLLNEAVIALEQTGLNVSLSADLKSLLASKEK